MKFVVFGGCSSVAMAFTRVASSEHEVINVLRDDRRATDVTALGGTPRVLDVDATRLPDVIAFVRELEPDTVLWAADPDPDPVSGVRAAEFTSSAKILQAAVCASVRRFILVSTMDARRPTAPVPSWYNDASRKASKALWKLSSGYMHAKSDAEVILFHSKLAYTILRPAVLTPCTDGGCELGRLQMTANPNIDRAALRTPTALAGAMRTCSPELVARVALACVAEPKTARMALCVANGSKGVDEEVGRCARFRIDAWEDR